MGSARIPETPSTAGESRPTPGDRPSRRDRRGKSPARPRTKRRSYSAGDIRYTTRQGRLYASVLLWPKGNQVKFATLAGEKITGVSLLGYTGRIAWRQEVSGLTVQLPADASSRVVPVLRIDRQP